MVDKRSAAYNKGKVFVHGASEATGVAYKRQFQSDLARFLRCRAGGAMFLVCLGRPSSAAPTDQGTVKYLFGAMFQDSWADLVREVNNNALFLPGTHNLIICSYLISNSNNA